MPARRVEITVPEEMWGRLEAARGHEPRASFVKRALESALGERPSVGHSASPREAAGSTPVTPAPSRASAKKVEVALEARDAVQKRNREKESARSGELPKIAKRHWA